MTRIIGGTAGGRRLKTPRGQHTRPTSDRVREALFSALEAWCGSLAGLRFLDLYAGSGAVGLEARSRGAGVVTLVEHDRRTAALIPDNVKTLGFGQVEVLAASVASTLARTPVAPYDVVFLDPPYPVANDEVEEALQRPRRPRLAVAGLPRRGRALGAGRAAGLARRPRARARQEVRRDLAAVWSRSHPTRARSGVVQCAERLSRVVRPGHQRHIDIISRASQLFDEVVVAVGVNKSSPSAGSSRPRSASPCSRRSCRTSPT